MGNNISPKTQKISHYQTYQDINYAACSMQGWRPTMQDSHLTICPFFNDNICLFAVFDGHYSAQVSSFAQKFFPKTLAENYNFLSGNYEVALAQTFVKIDHLMLEPFGKAQLLRIRGQNARRNNGLNYQGQCQAGSTANVILITRDYVYCANAGDSRAVAAIKTDKNTLNYKQLSIDHKPDMKVQQMRIKKAGGFVNHEGRINNLLNVSRGFGDFQFKRSKVLPYHEQQVIPIPDIRKLPRRQVEFIIMGCDGIWQRKSNQKMFKWIEKKRRQQNGNLVNVLQSLFQNQIAHRCFGQAGRDNMTAILIQLNKNQYYK